MKFDVANRQAHAWHDRMPVQSADREIFANSARADRVALALQGADHVERVEHHGAIGSAMVRRVVLMIPTQPVLGDERLKDGLLGHAAAREVDSFETTDHCTMIACRA